MELVGEQECEYGYEAVLELKLRLPKFLELDPIRAGVEISRLSLRPDDPLGEKNSSSSSSSSSSVVIFFTSLSSSLLKHISPLVKLEFCFGNGGRGFSSGEPSL